MIFKTAKFCRHIDHGLAHKLCTNYVYKAEISKNLYGLKFQFTDLTKTDLTRHTRFQNA
jgi:hypothetical protein